MSFVTGTHQHSGLVRGTYKQGPKILKQIANQPIAALVLPSDWDTFLDGRWADTPLNLVLRWLSVVLYCVINARLSMQEAGFLDGASTLSALTDRSMPMPVSIAVGAVVVWTGRGKMRYVFRKWVLRAHLGDADIRGFAGLGERVVARIEVLTFLSIFVLLVSF